MEEVLINGEKHYVRKDLFGWHFIHPIKNEDGSINWKNLLAGGSWFKLGLIILWVILMIGAINEYSSIAKLANTCLQELPSWVQIQI